MTLEIDGIGWMEKTLWEGAQDDAKSYGLFLENAMRGFGSNGDEKSRVN